MEEKNIDTLVKAYRLKEPMPSEIKDLINYAKVNSINTSKKQFTYQNKVYDFRLFSKSKWEQENLKILDKNYFILRTLKLAFSMDLIYPRVAIGASYLGVLQPLIIFQENNQDKVLDYETNLIMNKDDYYTLFKYKEYNVLNKMDMYKIQYLLENLTGYDYILYFLIFGHEIIDELSKNSDYSFLKIKYITYGINVYFQCLLGDNADNLFFMNKDYNPKYEDIIEQIDNFTENPRILPKNITYDYDKNSYTLKNKNIPNLQFRLLSDFTSDEISDNLLSSNRYHNCHINALDLTLALAETDESIYLVGGKFKINEVDYLFHSWIEIEDKNMVIDYNHNIIMNKDTYYKIWEVVPISKTPAQNIYEIIDTVAFKADLEFLHPVFINYFGEELKRDLKKNHHLFNKKND